MRWQGTTPFAKLNAHLDLEHGAPTNHGGTRVADYNL